MIQPPFAQSTYQVRMEWGVDGLARLAASDLVVVVDVFGRPDATHPVALAADGAEVVAGGIANASAVAAWVMQRQTERAARTSVAVVATDTGGPAGRFAVENHLGAGAVIAALGDLGIDHCSPEAAVAGEAFRALRRATRHLLTASGVGRAMVDTRGRDAVLAAATLDASTDVPVLRLSVE